MGVPAPRGRRRYLRSFLGAALTNPALLAACLALSCGGAQTGALVSTGGESPVVAGSPDERAGAAPVSVAKNGGACGPLEVDLPPMMEVPGLGGEVPPIVDTTGTMMDPFYERVAALLRGKTKRPVRIGVYGDSNMTMDFITGQMRRVLQSRFGDSGHGFIALARPWSHYIHRDVVQEIHFGITSYAASTHPSHDSYYGYSGLAGEATQIGAVATISTAGEGSIVGRSASRFGVYYLKRKHYGGFTIKVDGVDKATVDCNVAGTDVSAGYVSVDVPDGPHTFQAVSSSPGPVRWLGAVVERDVPGFIVDSLGMGAMNTRVQAAENAAVNEQMLRERGYDLVIFLTGANDIHQLEQVPGWLGKVLDVHRRALPNAALMLLPPPDRGKLKSFEPTMEVGAQRRELADSLKTAYWDLHTAMGGKGSMRRFFDAGLANSDYIHFNEPGGAFLGDRITRALLNGVVAYAQKHPAAGCKEEALAAPTTASR